LSTPIEDYYGVNYFITILGFSIYKSYYLSEQKTKNVNVYNNFIYELNKRIDDIKNHSMNKLLLKRLYMFSQNVLKNKTCNKVMKIVFFISTKVTSIIIH
jgi:hypothetical protein